MILFGPLRINLKVSSIFVSLFAVTIIITKSLSLLPSFLIKIFEWVGDRSYSIYLFHMPLLYLAKYSPVTKIGNGKNQIIYITIAIAASIMLGSLSFSIIENRFRNRDKSNLINLKNLIVSLALTLVFPLILFLLMDRSAVTHRVDVNLPVPSQPSPWKWDSNCQVMGEDSKIERPCVYGNLESDKPILLIGDSHAASNSRAIIEVAQHNSLKAIVFTQSSCPFILNKAELSDSYELPGLSTNCITHNQEILNYINIYKPTITILSIRSTSAYIFPNTKLSRALYRKNILNSLSDLRKSQTQIILVGSEPEYVPIATWIGKIFGQKGYYSEIPKEDGQWWSKVSIENFQYMSTLDIFCSQNKCKNKSGSIWLFNDEHHLSQQGAKMPIPELNLIVRKILNRSF